MKKSELEKNVNRNNNNNISNNNKKDICNHKFIVDYIDITPERSERIIYCTKCEECRESFPNRNGVLK